MADIFDEVSEDLRAERAKALLRRYGGLLVVLAVLLVVAVSGWQFWRYRSEAQAAAMGQAYSAAARDAGPAGAPDAAKKTAAQAFARLAAQAPEGYQTLARLREAGLLATAGDLPAALALWDQVSADTAADPLLRGLADLQWVQHQVDTGEPAAIEGRLAPLLARDNAWRAMAQECQAWLALRTGQDARARDILRGLRIDAKAPDGVRTRANGLLTRLGEPPLDTAGAAGG